MTKKVKAIIAVAAVAAVSIGTAVFLNNKSIQLNVTALENTVLEIYPNAVITSIEETIVRGNYLVKVTLEDFEYKIFITAKGEIINTSPKIPEKFKNQDI